MQAYSNPEREHDPYALPDLEIFQLTAHEIAERDEDAIHEFMKRPEYRLAAFNGRARDAMFQEIIDENCIEGGWFYWYCFPGCLPDLDPIGPFDSAQAARQAAQDDAVQS